MSSLPEKQLEEVRKIFRAFLKQRGQRQILHRPHHAGLQSGDLEAGAGFGDAGGVHGGSVRSRWCVVSCYAQA